MLLDYTLFIYLKNEQRPLPYTYIVKDKGLYHLFDYKGTHSPRHAYYKADVFSS